MAGKKSFAGQQNPALQTPAAAFISAAEKETQQPEGVKARAADPQGSQTHQNNHSAPAGQAPDGYMLNPVYIEKKTRRLQLLIKPSLFKAVQAKAAAEGQSVNECISAILEAATKTEE